MVVNDGLLPLQPQPFCFWVPSDQRHNLFPLSLWIVKFKRGATPCFPPPLCYSLQRDFHGHAPVQVFVSMLNVRTLISRFTLWKNIRLFSKALVETCIEMKIIIKIIVIKSFALLPNFTHKPSSPKCAMQHSCESLFCEEGLQPRAHKKQVNFLVIIRTWLTSKSSTNIGVERRALW